MTEQKRRRGRPELPDPEQKRNHTIAVTDRAWARLQDRAAETGAASISAYLETLMRAIANQNAPPKRG